MSVIGWLVSGWSVSWLVDSAISSSRAPDLEIPEVVDYLGVVVVSSEALRHHPLVLVTTSVVSIVTTITRTIHPSVHTSAHPSIDPSTHPSIHTSIESSIHQPIYRTIHPAIHPSIYPPTHPPIHSLIHPPIHSLIHQSTHPSTHLSFTGASWSMHCMSEVAEWLTILRRVIRVPWCRGRCYGYCYRRC